MVRLVRDSAQGRADRPGIAVHWPAPVTPVIPVMARARCRSAANSNARSWAVIAVEPGAERGDELLTVEEITKLRGELRKDGSTYAVVKNTLFKIAAGETIAKQLDVYLAGPTGIVFAGTDPIAPAKAIKQFADDSKKLGIKAAYIDGVLVDAKQVEVLASLPPKIELIAKLVGTLASPLRGLVTVLSGNQSGLVRVLNSIREQKEAAGSNA